METTQDRVRNFAIIAHIDHGKSTLADRMLEITGTVERAQKQTLDSNPIEQERGITIKLAPVRMEYKISNIKLQITNKFQNSNVQNSKQIDSLITQTNEENLTLDPGPRSGRGQALRRDEEQLKTKNQKLETYILNLIDTPGHVDFSYEVSRALAACEGAILLVDATQGIQAQTLAHYREAKRLNLTLIPAVNKIDLPSADVVSTKLQMMEMFGFEEEEIMEVSGKSGEGVEELLQRVIEKIPAPSGSPEAPLRGLVFNSNFSIHQGVVAWVKIVDGSLKKGDTVMMLGSRAASEVQEVGYFGIFNIKDKKLNIQSKDQIEKEQVGLSTGEVGYVVTGLKDPRLVQVGDTMVLKSSPKDSLTPLPGYNPPKPMIFASFYPTDQAEYMLLGEALDKLRLLDSSLTYTPESSMLLGNGFRVGFLGILHAEIVQERLDREFNLSVFASPPSVAYKIVTKFPPTNADEVTSLTETSLAGKLYEYEIHSPQELPDPSQYEQILEPVLEATVFTPESYINGLIKLFQDHRGQLADTKHAGSQVQMEYRLPLAELVGDFYSAFKSVSSGYASFDYRLGSWQAGDLVKLDILLAGDRVEALSKIVPRDQVERSGREIVEKLAEIIPRHNFEIAVQAVIGGKILARATVKPYRKDVTAKLYGGDPTRRMKLLEKQKKGKRKMKQFGKVSLPPDMFWKLLK